MILLLAFELTFSLLFVTAAVHNAHAACFVVRANNKQ